jgi:hypothetical protein
MDPCKGPRVFCVYLSPDASVRARNWTDPLTNLDFSTLKYGRGSKIGDSTSRRTEWLSVHNNPLTMSQVLPISDKLLRFFLYLLCYNNTWVRQVIKLPIRLSPGVLAILTVGFHGFSQSLYANSSILFLKYATTAYCQFTVLWTSFHSTLYISAADNIVK